MKISKVNLPTLNAFLILMFLSAICHAEIYKWVDANGETHFSERKIVAGAKAIEIKDKLPSTPPQMSNTTEYWQEQERQFRERQINKQIHEKHRTLPAVTAQKSLSGGTKNWADTDEWRCNLARDILSGAVVRTNIYGRVLPISHDERKLAEENVRAFCR